MPDRRDLVVYGAGLTQGIILVSFPAAEPVLRGAGGAGGFGFGATAYGLLFLPQVGLAIAAAVLGGSLTRRLGLKRLLLLGLGADAVSMTLFAVSALTQPSRPTSYAVLLVATGALGVGFGATVPTLSSLAADLHPQAVDRSLLVLNALLGLGTAMAPVLSAVFVGLGLWWGLPLLSLGLAGVLVAATLTTSLTTPAATPAPIGRVLRAGRFWLVAGVALLYGVVETLFGNWSEPLARSSLALSATVASVVLAAFWGSVTVGRVLFTVTAPRLPSPVVYRVLPWVAAAALLLAGRLPSGAGAGLVGVGVLGGLGCSALLPLTVGYGQDAFPTEREAMSGLVIAVYQVGYGVAAFGVGPLTALGPSLSTVFTAATLVAAALGAGTLVVVRTARTRVATAGWRPG